MKKVNEVRWAAFLMTLLANADVAETLMMADRATSGHLAKCERCGQTGPTVPPGPEVYRVRPAIRSVLLNSILPVRDDFVLHSARPAVSAAVTR